MPTTRSCPCCWWRASGICSSPRCSPSGSTTSSATTPAGRPGPFRPPPSSACGRGCSTCASSRGRRWPRPPGWAHMTEPMVRARQVHKSFGRLEVLKGIDLSVGPGEVLCLIGPSGSGKSTFLRCINHLEKIEGGVLYVDGHLMGYRRAGQRVYELPEREIAARRAEIGMVFQRFNLFGHMTVLQNVVEAPLRVKRE